MAEGVAVRPRADADLDRCVAILRAVHEASAYPVNWPLSPAAWLSPPGTLGAWVVAVGDEVLGHALLTSDVRDPDAASVERLYVDPAKTGSGLGRLLLDHLTALAGRRGLRLTLEVADNCRAAVAMYRRAGWLEVGSEPIEWGGEHAGRLLRFDCPVAPSPIAATRSSRR
jgi:ribosomal protein S18 acetylase RimI-like enzyme